MDTVPRRLTYSVVVALVATSPFVLLEGIYTSGFSRGVPLSVFIALWVLAAVFLYLVISIFRTKYKAPVQEWIVPFLLKISVTVPVVLAWTHLVADQMPCFLGGRGC